MRTSQRFATVALLPVAAVSAPTILSFKDSAMSDSVGTCPAEGAQFRRVAHFAQVGRLVRS
jgi:hypothetical protein